jgi:hypothetical protein
MFDLEANSLPVRGRLMEAKLQGKPQEENGASGTPFTRWK